MFCDTENIDGDFHASEAESLPRYVSCVNDTVLSQLIEDRVK